MIYLIIFFIFRNKINNFKGRKKPDEATFKYHHKEKPILEDGDGFAKAYSGYYNCLIFTNYFINEIKRYNSIIWKCRITFSNKKKRAFIETKNSLIKEQNSNGVLFIEYVEELKNYFDKWIDEVVFKYFPKKFVEMMVFNHQPSNINNRLAELSHCPYALDYSGFFYLFLPTCILMINIDKKIIIEKYYEKAQLSINLSSTTSLSSYDREVINTKWKYQRRDGGPDLRYNGNYATYTIRIYNLKASLMTFTRDWTFYHKENQKDIEKEFNSYNIYVTTLNPTIAYGGDLRKVAEYNALASKFTIYLDISDEGEASLNYEGKYYLPDNSIFYIPDGVTSLGESSFSHQDKIKEIHIPGSVKVIKRNAFYWCSKLETVIFEGDGLEEIQSYAFYSCCSLKKIILPKSIKIIGDGAFQYCERLEELGFRYGVFQINSKMVHLGYDIFENCSNIRGVFLNVNKIISPETLKRFDMIFIRSNIPLSLYHTILSTYNYKYLSIMDVGVLPTEVGAISNISYSQERVDIPLCVNSIKNCRLLQRVKEVYIPKSVTYIDNNFLFGTNLKVVGLPKHLKDKVKIKEGIKIYYTDSSITIEDEIEINEDNYKSFPLHQLIYAKTLIITSLFDELSSIIKKCKNAKKIEFRIASNSIPASILKNNEIVEEVVCSSNVKEIGESSFEGCINLKTFTADNIEVVGSYSYKDTAINNVEFTKNVLKVGDFAFSNCQSIHVASLDSTLDLGVGVFQGCKNLEEFTFNPKVNVVPTHFFEGCENLSNVNGVIKEVEEYAFSNCLKMNLEKVIFKLTSINAHAFENNILLNKIRINEKVKVVGEYAFSGCKGVKTIEVKDNIKLNQFCFAGTSISDISFISDKTKLGAGVFSACQKLTSIKIPYGFKMIPSSLFENCKKLNSVYIPDSVLSIGHHAFSKCIELKEITGMSEIMNVSFFAFNDCKSLTRLVFPQSLIEFINPISGCKKLTELVFTNNLEKLTLDLSDCFNLEKIYIPFEVKESNISVPLAVRNKVEFCCVRGSSWIRQTKYIKITYVPKEEFQIVINRYLLEAGFPLLASFNKIKMDEKHFGKFDDDFDFDMDDLGYDSTPVPKKRAGWDVTNVKEGNNTSSNIDSNKENKKGYKISIYEKPIPFNEKLVSLEINSELFTSDKTVVSSIYPTIYHPVDVYTSAYSFIVDKKGHLISSVIKVENIKEGDTIEYSLELDGDCSNGTAYLLFVNESFEIISSKALYIDRAYNIDALLDF